MLKGSLTANNIHRNLGWVGETACLVNNAEGAWISMRGLSGFIRIFESNKYVSELKKNALEAILGLEAAAYASELTSKPDFGLESVPDYSLKLLREHSRGIDLLHEGMEIYIKAHAVLISSVRT